MAKKESSINLFGILIALLATGAFAWGVAIAAETVRYASDYQIRTFDHFQAWQLRQLRRAAPRPAPRSSVPGNMEVR